MAIGAILPGNAQAGCYRLGKIGYHLSHYCWGRMYPHHRVCRHGYCRCSSRKLECYVRLRYRVLAVEVDEGYLWFWIGSHAEYDRLIGRSTVRLAHFLIPQRFMWVAAIPRQG
jgi:hypothetical protein